MRETRALMTMFAAMAISADNSFMSSREYKEELTEKEKEELKSVAERERNKRNGLNEFKYDLGSVWALNRSNADRKARKKGYLLNTEE